MLHVDLSQLAGGTLQEKFDREITRVIDNMQDPILHSEKSGKSQSIFHSFKTKCATTQRSKFL